MYLEEWIALRQEGELMVDLRDGLGQSIQEEELQHRQKWIPSSMQKFEQEFFPWKASCLRAFLRRFFLGEIWSLSLSRGFIFQLFIVLGTDFLHDPPHFGIGI